GPVSPWPGRRRWGLERGKGRTTLPRNPPARAYLISKHPGRSSHQSLRQFRCLPFCSSPRCNLALSADAHTELALPGLACINAYPIRGTNHYRTALMPGGRRRSQKWGRGWGERFRHLALIAVMRQASSEFGVPLHLGKELFDFIRNREAKKQAVAVDWRLADIAIPARSNKSIKSQV